MEDRNPRRRLAANHLEQARQLVQNVVSMYSVATPNQYNKERRRALHAAACLLSKLLNEEENLAHRHSEDLLPDKHYIGGMEWQSRCDCA